MNDRWLVARSSRERQYVLIRHFACVFILFLFSTWHTTLKMFQIDEAKVCVCVSVCLLVCLPLASDSSETLVQVIIVKMGTVTASDMGMHHVLIIVILTLTFIHSHTYLNHEINKCLIISQIFKQCPSLWDMKGLKVYIMTPASMTLTFIQGHKCVSNFTILFNF